MPIEYPAACVLPHVAGEPWIPWDDSMLDPGRAEYWLELEFVMGPSGHQQRLGRNIFQDNWVDAAGFLLSTLPASVTANVLRVHRMAYRHRDPE